MYCKILFLAITIALHIQYSSLQVSFLILLNFLIYSLYDTLKPSATFALKTQKDLFSFSSLWPKEHAMCKICLESDTWLNICGTVITKLSTSKRITNSSGDFREKLEGLSYLSCYLPYLAPHLVLLQSLFKQSLDPIF